MIEIGKIDRPDVERYKNKRKIYYVRNLYLPKNATDGYKEIITRYWSEVEEYLEELEVAGKVSKIFCESIYMSGDEAMHVLKSMDARMQEIVKKKIDAGGQILPLESKEIFGTYIDWYNCLTVVRTPNVHEMIHEFLDETIKKRFEHIKSVLNENITDSEAALLLMRDGEQKLLSLPDDIELFNITPPAYDDLVQFIKDAHGGKEFWRS